jgi:hypothetical protein
MSEIEDKINEEIETWNVFDKYLFLVYHRGASVREISIGSKIGMSKLFRYLKPLKSKIAVKFNIDYQKYRSKKLKNK